MQQKPNCSDCNIVTLAAKRNKMRDAEVVEMVDRITKQLHYALIPIQTSVSLARRHFELPPLD